VKLFEPAQYEAGRVSEVILAGCEADGWHSGQKSLERNSRLCVAQDMLDFGAEIEAILVVRRPRVKVLSNYT